jgi:hypothetical protein
MPRAEWFMDTRTLDLAQEKDTSGAAVVVLVTALMVVVGTTFAGADWAPIKVDLIKLTHHGSKFNICNELIEMIDCDNFIISSNDRNFSKKLYQGYL